MIGSSALPRRAERAWGRLHEPRTSANGWNWLQLIPRSQALPELQRP